MAQLQIREALRRAMSEEMRRDPDIFLMGEEVAFYDGAYKVSQGMLAEFGEKRVIDTPIAENGFCGNGHLYEGGYNCGKCRMLQLRQQNKGKSTTRDCHSA